METDQELALLRARVAHLESLVEKLSGARAVVRRDAARDEASSPPSGLDRRRMLRHGLGLSAAAVAGVGMLDAVGSSAAAADGDAVTVGQTSTPSDTASAATRIANPSDKIHAATLFQVDNTTDTTMNFPAATAAAIVGNIAGHDDDPMNDPPYGIGVLGQSQFGAGVMGYSEGDIGVAGKSTFGDAIAGIATMGSGVSATSSSGPGLTATSTSGRAVVARSDSGEGINATSTSNIGIVGSGPFGVVGNGTDGSGGVGGTGVGATGDTGVLAHGSDVAVDATSQSGIGVRATTTSGTGLRATSTSGHGLDAVSTNGVGATFQGAAAAVRLVPLGTTGHPTAGHHNRGELVVDNTGVLWMCTHAGTPGKWKQVAFV